METEEKGRWLHVKCPYCEHDNLVFVDLNIRLSQRPRVTCCDLESGGCERYFAYTFTVVAQATGHAINC
jgi:transposase-like protein